MELMRVAADPRVRFLLQSQAAEIQAQTIKWLQENRAEVARLIGAVIPPQRMAPVEPPPIALEVEQAQALGQPVPQHQQRLAVMEAEAGWAQTARRAPPAEAPGAPTEIVGNRLQQLIDAGGDLTWEELQAGRTSPSQRPPAGGIAERPPSSPDSIAGVMREIRAARDQQAQGIDPAQIEAMVDARVQAALAQRGGGAYPAAMPAPPPFDPRFPMRPFMPGRR